jgi:DNA-binding NarL/FixJ family response regulator
MSPARHRRFLVIDVNSDSRFLLVKTLLRKFPHSVIDECQDADAAIAAAGSAPLDAIVTHRSLDIDGITLVRLLRAANPTVPIVMVSGSDRSREAVEAGANRFLSYDEWLRIGTVVLETLAPSPPTPESPSREPSPPPSQTTTA